MKKIVLVLFLLTSSLCFSQTGWFWQSQTPQGTKLTDVAFLNSNTVIAIGNGGTIIKSTNLGISWDVKNIVPQTDFSHNFLININVFNEQSYAILSTTTNIYTLYRTIKVYKTSDGGNTWNSFFVDSLFAKEMEKIKFINANTGWIYNTRIIPAKIYKTTNGGANWNIYSINGIDSLANLFFLNENTGWIQIGSGNDYYKTNDGGNTWIPRTASYPFVQPFFINEMTGWLRNPLQDSKTTDGINFTSIGTSAYVQKYSFFNENTGWSLFFTYGIRTTTNSGTNWINTNYPDNYAIQLNAASFLNVNTGFAVGNYGRILKTTEGRNWSDNSSSIVHYSRISGMSFVNPNTGWVWSESGISRTNDGGSSWTQIDSFYTTFYCMKFFDANTGFRVSQNLMERSTNGGMNWSTYPIGEFNFTGAALNIINENTGYFYGYNYTLDTQRLLKTTDKGNTWIEKQTPDSVSFSPFFITESTGFIAGTFGTYKTTNGAASWTLMSPVPTAKCFFINENTGWDFGHNNTLSKTTNGGVSWQVQFYKGPNFGISQVYFSNTLTGYLSGSFNYEGIILKTTNGGINWINNLQLNTGQLTDMIFLNENTGWVCGLDGILLKTTTGGTIGIQQISASLPDKFYLSQNYPNPFNPNTNIEFSLPQKSFVKLKVFDLLGREVANLVNENLSAGSYKYDFNASLLPSGIYFYKLEALNFSETRKMVLLK